MYGHNAKTVRSLNDIPTTAHFAIIKTVSVYIPGDERSRTNPGHGYPGGSETYISYSVYEKEEDWKAAINDEMNSTYANRGFRAVRVQPAQISTEIKVSIS